MTRVDADLLAGSTVAFGLAIAGLFGMGTMVLSGEPDAVQAIVAITGLGGVSSTPWINLAAAFDLLLPIGYGAGLCLLAAALAPGRPALFAAVLTMTSFGLVADFIENGMLLAGLTGGVPATLAKFGFLGLAWFFVVTMLPSDRVLHRVAKALGWGVIPLALAALIADFPMAREPLVFVVGLSVVFAMLGLIAWRLRA